MFTIDDLESLVPRKIFDRGEAYYLEYDAVGRIKQKGNVFKAKVEGTETYRVELTVNLSGPPTIWCDCPYDYGDVCKHGIALGLAVLDLVGDGEPEPAPPPVPAPRAANAAPPTPQQLRDALQLAFDRTSDKQKLAYLGQLLYQQPNLIPGFLDAFDLSLPLLLAPKPQPRPAAKPPAEKAKPKLRPAARRTFVQVGQDILRTGYPPDLLPHLLRHDWRTVTEADAPKLTVLLMEAARQQPEPTLDAVMERIESYLAATQRSPNLHAHVVVWLVMLSSVSVITAQVRLFASELWKQYGRRVELRAALTQAGFAPLSTDEQEAALRQKKAAARAKADPSATPPQRPGRPSRPKK
ncbi:hypothetical protein A0257_18855 [Hymenobacter psoromatis]|nr:hypothetical protein A0257_18855 [Hymenobacter psoromatis]